MGITIKDAPLVEQLSGDEKIPVSDGSGLPKAVTAEQMKDYIAENITVDNGIYLLELMSFNADKFVELKKAVENKKLIQFENPPFVVDAYDKIGQVVNVTSSSVILRFSVYGVVPQVGEKKNYSQGYVDLECKSNGTFTTSDDSFKIERTGNGKKFLSDDGTYKEVTSSGYDDTEIKAQIKKNSDDIAANKEDADAKLSELGSKVSFELNNNGEGIGAFWRLSTEDVKAVPEEYPEDIFRYVEQIKVKKGDTFLLNSKGGNNARAYAFTDKYKKIQEVSAANSDVKGLIIAPCDGFLFVNCSKDGYETFSLSTISVMEYIENLKKDFEQLQDCNEVFMDEDTKASITLRQKCYWNGSVYYSDSRYEATEKIDVKKGDIVIVQGAGGNTGRLIFYYNNSNEFLYKSEPLVKIDILFADEDGYVICSTRDTEKLKVSIRQNSKLYSFYKASKSAMDKRVYTCKDLIAGTFFYLGNLSVGDKAPLQANPYGDTTWGSIKIPVLKDMEVKLKVRGGNNGRAYALTDSDLVILDLAEANFETITNPIVISVKQNGFLYVNQTRADDTDFLIETTCPISNQVEELRHKITGTSEEKIIAPCMFNPVINLQKERLRVLDIGNSYTDDSTFYLPNLIESAGVDVSDMCLYTAIKGGASFKNWVDVYKGRDTSGYNITKKFGGLTADISSTSSGDNSEKLRNALTNNEWDLIIIHQVSAYAPYYEDWIGDGSGGCLKELISIIRKHQPKATIGFLLVHSYWSGYGGNREGSSYERWKLIAESAKKLRINFGFDFIIPYGTAIQNIRASSLNTEHDLTTDGTHCAEGLGDYTASCAYYQSLIAPRYGVSILGNPYRVDVVPNGTYQESEISVTDENALIAQKAAFLACYNWYECINPEDVDL